MTNVKQFNTKDEKHRCGHCGSFLLENKKPLYFYYRHYCHNCDAFKIVTPRGVPQ
jgi:hypothetical protein